MHRFQLIMILLVLIFSVHGNAKAQENSNSSALMIRYLSGFAFFGSDRLGRIANHSRRILIRRTFKIAEGEIEFETFLHDAEKGLIKTNQAFKAESKGSSRYVDKIQGPAGGVLELTNAPIRRGVEPLFNFRMQLADKKTYSGTEQFLKNRIIASPSIANSDRRIELRLRYSLEAINAEQFQKHLKRLSLSTTPNEFGRFHQSLGYSSQSLSYKTANCIFRDRPDPKTNFNYIVERVSYSDDHSVLHYTTFGDGNEPVDLSFLRTEKNNVFRLVSHQKYSSGIIELDTSVPAFAAKLKLILTGKNPEDSVQSILEIERNECTKTLPVPGEENAKKMIGPLIENGSANFVQSLLLNPKDPIMFAKEAARRNPENSFLCVGTDLQPNFDPLNISAMRIIWLILSPNKEKIYVYRYDGVSPRLHVLTRAGEQLPVYTEQDNQQNSPIRTVRLVPDASKNDFVAILSGGAEQTDSSLRWLFIHKKGSCMAQKSTLIKRASEIATYEMRSEVVSVDMLEQNLRRVIAGIFQKTVTLR